MNSLKKFFKDFKRLIYQYLLSQNLLNCNFYQFIKYLPTNFTYDVFVILI